MHSIESAFGGFAALLEPETMLPEQYRDTCGPVAMDRPEMRLLLAVIEDGLAILQRGALDATYRSSREFAEAAAWVASDDRAWPFSFENACDALAWDTVRVRRLVATWLEGHGVEKASNHRFGHRRQNGSRHSINLPRRRSPRKATAAV